MKRSLTTVALPMSLLVLCVLGAAACRLDTNTMRKSLLDQASGAEKLFYLENIASKESSGDLGPAARQAASFGYVHVLQYLKSRDVDLNAADTEGWSPMLLAARNGQLPVMRYLVEIVGTDVRAKNRIKATCLMLAAEAGHEEMCRYLLDRGANVDAKSIHGTTALMHAAASGKVELARHLVERGADTKIRDNLGNLALAYAEGEAMQAYLRGLGLE